MASRTRARTCLGRRAAWSSARSPGAAPALTPRPGSGRGRSSMPIAAAISASVASGPARLGDEGEPGWPCRSVRYGTVSRASSPGWRFILRTSTQQSW